MKKNLGATSLFLALTMILVTASAQAADVWIKRADMPTALNGHAVAEANNKIYVIGGNDISPGEHKVQTTDEYDPATNTWTKKADMPTARGGHSTVTVNGKIYAIGGFVGSIRYQTVEEYDPATDNWTTKANMPTARESFCAAVVNNKIYAIGGSPSSGSAIRTVEVYDPVTDNWTTRTDMPTARCGAGVAVVNNKIYVIGGWDGLTSPIQTVEEYDPSKDTWTTLKNMPTLRYGLTAAAVDNKIYAIGGYNGAWLHTNEEYNPLTNSWTTKTSMPTARIGMCTAVVNNQIYVIGGNVNDTTNLSNVEAYSISYSVPDTGQTACYNDNGVEIICPRPGEPYYGQDAQYSINPPSYTKLDANSNALLDNATSWTMVQDDATRLIWEMKDSQDGVKNYGNPHDADNTYTWYNGSSGTPGSGTDTLDFINALNAAVYGGYSDWRLPTPKELASIVLHDRYSPVINTAYFSDTLFPDINYWTSISSVDNANYAWYVNFGYGYEGSYFKSSSYPVRAVRGGQSPNNFIDNGDGTVTDTSTGLMWQQTTAVGAYTWGMALDYCENLSLADYDDWRLPNKNELQSLTDYTRSNPAINTTYFPGTQADYYWTSTTGLPSTYHAWRENFSKGDIDGGYKYNDYRVRAVRGGGNVRAASDLNILLFSANPLNGSAPLDVNFICYATDDNGTIVEYLWDFDGDGVADNSTAESTITHTYQNPGTFNASVIAVNEVGLSVRSLDITIIVFCPFSFNPEQDAYSAAGGSGSVSITASDAGCPWSAASNADWITITSATNGTGSSNLNYSVAPNIGPARIGTITVMDNTFTVNQSSGCVLLTNGTEASYLSAGGGGSVNIIASDGGCAWTAASSDGWITITSSVSGSGSAAVSYTVDANEGPARSGAMTIAGHMFTVNQSSGCTYDIDADNATFVQAGGSGSVGITTSDDTCAWTAASNALWITIDSGSTGSDNGTVNYTVAANLGPERRGTITIAGHTFTVIQSGGCTYQINAGNATFDAAGGMGAVQVTSSDAGCGWTATSNDSWIAITSGATGSGNAAVIYATEVNSDAARTGTITVAGYTFTVIQGYAKGALQVTITPQEAIDAGAQWRRVGTETWLHSGQVEGGLEVGQYDVEFKTVEQWNNPATQTAILDSASALSPVFITGAYTPGCTDKDGDGYGEGGGCLGPDCNDNDSSVHDTCTTCTVKLIPGSISKLGSLLKPVRMLLISAEEGVQFSIDTAVVWDTEAVETLNKFLLGKNKRLLLVQVLVKSQKLDAGAQYAVRVGDCAGKLQVRAF